MKQMNRQIVGFILGTVFLVIVLILLFRFLSYSSSVSVEINNRGVANWFADGIKSAYTQGGWDAGEDNKKLLNSNDKNYAVFLITSDVAKWFGSQTKCGMVDEGCYDYSADFKICNSTSSYCICLVSTDGKFNEGLYTDTCNWNTISDTEISRFRSIIENGYAIHIIQCKDMGFSGIKDKVFIKKGSSCVYGFGAVPLNIKLERKGSENNYYIDLTSNG